MKQQPDIDWLAVETVCSGKPMKITRWEEKYAVVRALNHRMLNERDSNVDLPPGILTAHDVASLMKTHVRSVCRVRAKLQPATKMRCPRCREQMWVRDDGLVEPHPNRWNDTCGYEQHYDVAAIAS